MKFIINIVLNTIPRPLLIKLSKYFTGFTALLLKGNTVVCPVCGGHFRKFLPYGYAQVRNNALCPRCLSLERHRLLWLYLEKQTTFFTRPAHVLHIAPEQCFVKRFRKLPHLQYTTADLESPLADIKMDVQHMPLNDCTFDVLICNHVLEHVPDLRKTLSEIYRVLKPGGYAILLSPIDFTRTDTFEDATITDPTERTRVFGQYDHLRVFGRNYPEVIKQAGFVVTETNFIEAIPESDTIRYALPTQEFMFSYIKKA